jgi:hypothetical protein
LSPHYSVQPGQCGFGNSQNRENLRPDRDSGQEKTQRSQSQRLLGNRANHDLSPFSFAPR